MTSLFLTFTCGVISMKIQFTRIKEVLTHFAGMAGVGSLVDLTKLKTRLNHTHLKEAPRPTIPHGDVATAYLGLLCQGKTDFDHIEALREDEWFFQSLGLKAVPSSPTLRQRLDQGAQNPQWLSIILAENTTLLRRSQTTITPVVAGEKRYAPLDIDVSPFNNSGTKKEGVSWTYKGFEGYSPIFAYLGREGYAINVELREGKDHCQKKTEPFLRESIRSSQAVTKMPILVRMDSGNDSRANLKACIDTHADFIIKRNLRKEKPEFWLAYAQEHAVAEAERAGKIVYRGVKELTLTIAKKKYPLRMVYIVTERTILANGQILLTPAVEVASYWTTLTVEPKKIEELYRDHATSEQFHSEIKTDMDLERLPSGKFETNKLILTLAIFAYNILRIMGQYSLGDPQTPLKRKAERRRIRTVIQNLITCAARFIKHSRRLALGFAVSNKWYAVIKNIYEKFHSLAEVPV